MLIPNAVGWFTGEATDVDGARASFGPLGGGSDDLDDSDDVDEDDGDADGDSDAESDDEDFDPGAEQGKPSVCASQ